MSSDTYLNINGDLFHVLEAKFHERDNGITLTCKPSIVDNRDRILSMGNEIYILPMGEYYSKVEIDHDTYYSALMSTYIQYLKWLSCMNQETTGQAFLVPRRFVGVRSSFPKLLRIESLEGCIKLEGVVTDALAEE